MKNLDKLKSLTNNPITLLLGLNHFYLSRVFTCIIRGGISFFALIFGLLIFDGKIEWLVMYGFIWGIYFLIDKVRIEGHFRKYQRKFNEALDLLRNKEFFKGFKKLIKFGLKDSINWIMENEPELLTDSILGNISQEKFAKITGLIERKDVDGVISELRKSAFKLQF